MILMGNIKPYGTTNQVSEALKTVKYIKSQ